MQVVLLCLFQLADLVPAEGSVVERLEMFGVQVDGPGIVLYGLHVVPLLPVREATIVVEIGLASFELDGF
jgi:hypothetical protein